MCTFNHQKVPLARSCQYLHASNTVAFAVVNCKCRYIYMYIYVYTRMHSWTAPLHHPMFNNDCISVAPITEPADDKLDPPNNWYCFVLIKVQSGNAHRGIFKMISPNVITTIHTHKDSYYMTKSIKVQIGGLWVGFHLTFLVKWRRWPAKAEMSSWAPRCFPSFSETSHDSLLHPWHWYNIRDSKHQLLSVLHQQNYNFLVAFLGLNILFQLPPVWHNTWS